MGNGTDAQLADMTAAIHTTVSTLAIRKEDAYIGVGTLPNQCGVFVRLLSHSAEPVNHLVKALSVVARGYHFE